MHPTSETLRHRSFDPDDGFPVGCDPLRRGQTALDELIDVPGVFEACSENGFVVYSGARQPWTCKFPGVTAALEF